MDPPAAAAGAAPLAGDAIFLDLIGREDTPFFSLKLRYQGETLIQAVLNGRERDLRLDPTLTKEAGL